VQKCLKTRLELVGPPLDKDLLDHLHAVPNAPYDAMKVTIGKNMIERSEGKSGSCETLEKGCTFDSISSAVRRSSAKHSAPIEVLLVEDNPADVHLTTDTLSQNRCPIHVHAVTNGVEALAFLHHSGQYATACLPDLVILDLNLPGKDGRAVLSEVKSDPILKTIPIVTFSTSQACHDIAHSYELGANGYVNKPGDLHGFIAAVTSMRDFWLAFACLPHMGRA
jgi:chemotaxis family two-component system response regulator Rcp1